MATTEPHGRGHRGVYRDVKGDRRKTKVFCSKRAALQAAQDEESKLRAGTWFDPTAGKVTFSAYFEKQFPNRGGEQTTRDTYLSHYDAPLKGKFGDMELRRIPSTVQGWVAEMQAAGMKPSTSKTKVKALQTILAAKEGASAMRDGLIISNPVHGVLLPTTVDPEVLIYEPDTLRPRSRIRPRRRRGTERTLDRALDIDRSAYAVGQEVHVYDLQRDEHWTGTIRAIDWTHGAGPIVVEDVCNPTRIAVHALGRQARTEDPRRDRRLPRRVMPTDHQECRRPRSSRG